MTRRIGAISFIFGCTALAWIILAGTITNRTYSSGDSSRKKVVASWGSAQVQGPPAAVFSQPAANGNGVTTVVAHPEASRIDVDLDLDQRQKGLLWYSTYKVGFAGTYTFRNPTDQPQKMFVTLKLPAEQAIYDDLQVLVNDSAVAPVNGDGCISAATEVPPGKAVNVRFAYRSHGLDTWRYDFGGKVAHVHDFVLRIHTNFKAIDFPESTLSPTEKKQVNGGWELTWNYKSLVSGFAIGIAMPEHVQPGPLAGEISYFAPVSLLFFFFVMFMITTIRGIELHPMNYFFLAAAFFAFHLLLAYLADHISIHAAFAICSLVSVFLVVSYLRLVVGMRFAAVEAGISQFVYLVLFSYAFFYHGYTGLTVTVGAILSLFVAMQMTGRIKWSEKFQTAPNAPRTV
ncbi:MAG: inner membrane CreD family protein [Terriglobales bacterium]